MFDDSNRRLPLNSRIGLHDPTQIEASQWRQIVNGASDTAIISTDLEGRVASWNTGAALILGWSESEMLGSSLERIFTLEDQERGQFNFEMLEARRTGRGGGEEGWRVRKDGSRFWAAGELSPIRQGDDILGFIKILRDRTAQRASEQQVAEEREALEITNRAISALALENDRQRLIQLVTDASVALSGAEFGAFFHNVVNEQGERYLLDTLSGAPIEAFATFPMPRNTAIFAPTFEGRAIIRSDDITKDPRYGQNPPYRGMPPGHLPVRSYLAVPVVTRQGNTIGGLFLGHSAPHIFTERSETRLVGLAAEAAVAIENAMLTQQLKVFNATLEQQVAERTQELLVNEEALRQAQKMEAVGQLTGGVAHDFNNLLQVIIGNLEIVRRVQNADSPRLARATESAIAAAKRAAALTQRLLAFSRRQPLNPKPVDVNVLVAGMSDLLYRALGEPVELETVRGMGLWTVEADPNELEAAILNLAVNARDAMPSGGRLTIETSNVELDQGYAAAHAEVIAGQYVCVSTSDTGNGMDASTLNQAFEPFFTTKPVGQGTGLGLSQVYGFVKQSGGHVKIYSEVGHGTTVRLYLPRYLQTRGASLEPEQPRLPQGVAGETILVTEDDNDVRAYAVDLLRDLGYRVMEASDGAATLKLLEHNPDVHLLFTDVVLRGHISGAQLAAEVRGRYPHIKILFTTGYARNAIVHHGRLDRGVQLITKPYTAADLSARLRDILDGALRDSATVYAGT